LRSLGIPRGVKMFHPYTLVVKNAGGHVLKRASIRTMLAEQAFSERARA
jgi:hypothetical protein